MAGALRIIEATAILLPSGYRIGREKCLYRQNVRTRVGLSLWREWDWWDG